MMSTATRVVTSLDLAVAELAALLPADQEAVLLALPVEAARALRQRLLSKAPSQDHTFESSLEALASSGAVDASQLAEVSHLDLDSLPVGIVATLLVGLDGATQKELMSRYMSPERADKVGQVLSHIPAGRMHRTGAELRRLFAPGTHPNQERRVVHDQNQGAARPESRTGARSIFPSRVKPW